MLASLKRAWAVAIGATIAAGLAFPAGPANADLLAEIKKRGEFIVGTEARFPPFEFVKDGKIVGYSTDIMVHVMKALPGVKLKRLDLPWQGILPGLAASKFDYVVTSVTVTKERYAKYALSLPIADATMALVKRKGDASIKAPEDIAGHVVGSQAGSAQLQALQAFANGLKSAGKGSRESRHTSISTRLSPIWRQGGSAPFATACQTCSILSASGRIHSKWCCRRSAPRNISAGPVARMPIALRW